MIIPPTAKTSSSPVRSTLVSFPHISTTAWIIIIYRPKDETRCVPDEALLRSSRLWLISSHRRERPIPIIVAIVMARHHDHHHRRHVHAIKGTDAYIPPKAIWNTRVDRYTTEKAIANTDMVNPVIIPFTNICIIRENSFLNNTIKLNKAKKVPVVGLSPP